MDVGNHYGIISTGEMCKPMPSTGNTDVALYNRIL